MSTQTPYDVRVGQLVRVDDPKWSGQWRVEKVNKVNHLLVNVATGARLRCHFSFIRPWEDGETSVTERPASDPRGGLRSLHAGEFVRYVGVTHSDLRTGDVYVVLTDKYEKINCAKAGGAGGRYWRFLPRDIEPISVEDAVESLIG
jgi:hypothetical protein